MTLPILLLLIILTIALLLFWFEWIPPDVTALGVLLALILLGLVPLDQAFAGFGSDTVMVILGLLIMTAALVRTGVVEAVSRRLLKLARNHPENDTACNNGGCGAVKCCDQQYGGGSLLFAGDFRTEPAL
jgi:Na+/H+ antiporter NhaD/arsenite permease-like protein